MSLKSAEFAAEARAEQVQEDMLDKEQFIAELATDLMTGKEIWYRDHTHKRKTLNLFIVAERYQEMDGDGKFPFILEALATLFGSNGEQSDQMIHYGYKAAESLIEEFYDSIVEIMRERDYE